MMPGKIYRLNEKGKRIKLPLGEPGKVLTSSTNEVVYSDVCLHEEKERLGAIEPWGKNHVAQIEACRRCGALFIDSSSLKRILGISEETKNRG